MHGAHPFACPTQMQEARKTSKEKLAVSLSTYADELQYRRKVSIN
jgi:hypothetical protein